jgi:O-methyltransferase
MYSYLHESSIKGREIDFLEFGVFEGASIQYWMELNLNHDSRFFGFDSFEGLPEDWRPGSPKGRFDVGGLTPVVDDRRVTFVRGWFEDTIPQFVNSFSSNNRLVLHLDADLYGSSMLALTYFTPFMRKGTVLIFDEFFDLEHEAKAFKDWGRIYRKSFRVIAEVQNYAQICAELL